MEASINSKNTNLFLRAYHNLLSKAMPTFSWTLCLYCPSLAEDPGEGGSLAVISEGSDDY